MRRARNSSYLKGQEKNPETTNKTNNLSGNNSKHCFLPQWQEARNQSQEEKIGKAQTHRE